MNKVILIGNLGQDPKIRYMTNGGAVANLSMATSETLERQADRRGRRETEWHRVVAFRKPAEIMAEYLSKGSKIYIEGKLVTRKWQDSRGSDRYTTEIHVDQFQFLGDGQQRGKPEHKRAPSEPDLGDNRGNAAPDFDDDIPF